MPVAQKVALVVDALPAMGGAERVLMDAMQLFPDAPIYSFYYNRRAFSAEPIAARQVFSSFIDHLPTAHSNYRKYFPFMLMAMRGIDLEAYELIISFSYAVAHGVHIRPGQRHLSYTFTPMRYAWRDIGVDGRETSSHPLINWLFRGFRRWDRAAVTRVDRLATVSCWIANLVGKAYQRPAAVIYPPVEVERYSPQPEHGEYFITISRLVAHKRIDLILQAFNCLKLPLLVIGEGPDRSRLERLAGPTIKFLGFIPEHAKAELLARSRGFISAGEEDFGIAVVEAQAAGIPVVAYNKGGVLETVVDGETGLFFDEPCAQSLADAVDRLRCQAARFHPGVIAASVQRFNKQRFLQEFEAFTHL
jgi:glycosyltransferase involved in cell wall biosynthesis